MFCPNCGNEIIPGSKFCGSCGCRVEQPRPPKKKNKGLIIALSIIGAILLLLIILAVAGFILLRRYSAVNDDNLYPNEIEEIIEEKEAEIQEAIEEAAEGVEEAFPELIDVPAEDEDILMKNARAAAYLDVIREHKDRIRGYIWQDDFGENDWDDRGIAIEENRPVILADIGGDEAEELVILETVDDEYGRMYASNLHAFAYDGEDAADLGEEVLDVQAGGGTYYALFGVKDDKALYLYRSWGDEIWTDSFIRYEAADGGLQKTYELSSQTMPDEDDYEKLVWTYSENDSEINEDEFAAKKTALIDSIDTIYCWNLITDEELQAKLKGVSPAAYTYSEAADELKSEAGDLAADAEEEDILTDEEAELWIGALGAPSRTFMFSSGAGGWWTELTLNADGTFAGNFIDSDMGDDRAPHGVQYVSHFNGRFSALTKIDDYKYSMKLESLETDDPVGEEWEEDQVLYIASDPYGLAGGDTFYLYLPGQSTSELPAEYVEWIRMPMGYESAPDYLPFYGIYNEKEECGFFSTEG